MELDLKRLGQRIRFYRQGLNLSLSELADLSGISKAYISGLENGEGGIPNIQHLYKIATKLDLSLDRLLDETAPGKHRSTKRDKEEAELPPGLREFAEEQQLSFEEVEMLATLNFRGSRPKDKEAWRLIYNAIRFGSK